MFVVIGMAPFLVPKYFRRSRNKIKICQTLATNDVVFDLADITLEYEEGKKVVLLEAYKTASNDRIIESKDNEKYSQLNWVSIGNPTISKILPQAEIFNFRPDGFDIFVELLNQENKKRLVDAIKKKYNISVSVDQVLTLKPGRFECRIELYDDGNKFFLNGKARDLNTFPIRVSFPYPDTNLAIERKALEKRLVKDNNDPDLEIKCEAYSQGQAYRENTLILSSKQMNQLNLADDIFGPESEVFVTRNQLNRLSQELYQKLNIIEEYQIAEKEFEQSFITEFLKQTAVYINQYTPFDKALSQLSSFSLAEDLKPDVIKEELSKTFVLKKRGTKDFLVLNDSLSNKSYVNSSMNIGSSGSVKIPFIKVGSTRDFAKSKAKDWEDSNSSYSEQLNELNNYDQNDVEWVKKGRMIVPRRIKVSKLVKSELNNDLKFSRIRREYYDAPFSRVFSFRTKLFDKISANDRNLLERTLILKDIYLEKAKSIIENDFDSVLNIQNGKWFVTFANRSIPLTAKLTGFKNKPKILYSVGMVGPVESYEILDEIITNTSIECKLDLSIYEVETKNCKCHCKHTQNGNQNIFFLKSGEKNYAPKVKYNKNRKKITDRINGNHYYPAFIFETHKISVKTNK
ncbi:hypothetical protein BpHYR1_039935 [Brachionus plicatilis]|uniref:Uncharacterized protein n=1 Tax=Brachionus plicatilis TaxID=10195 RepID=A0A3M7Q6Q7_BRAPC|nr:hypothetical protein BpHYR1_039935 [Brachionus plicatilis]